MRLRTTGRAVVTLDHSQLPRVVWREVDRARWESQSSIGRDYGRTLYRFLRYGGMSRWDARRHVRYALAWADQARSDGYHAGRNALAALGPVQL